MPLTTTATIANHQCYFEPSQCDLIETPDETAAGLSAQRDRDRQQRNSVDYFEVALTDIDRAS